MFTTFTVVTGGCHDNDVSPNPPVLLPFFPPSLFFFLALVYVLSCIVLQSFPPGQIVFLPWKTASYPGCSYFAFAFLPHRTERTLQDTEDSVLSVLCVPRRAVSSVSSVSSRGQCPLCPLCSPEGSVLCVLCVLQRTVSSVSCPLCPPEDSVLSVLCVLSCHPL